MQNAKMNAYVQSKQNNLLHDITDELYIL